MSVLITNGQAGFFESAQFLSVQVPGTDLWRGSRGFWGALSQNRFVLQIHPAAQQAETLASGSQGKSRE